MRKTRERKRQPRREPPAPDRAPRAEPDRGLLDLQHGAGNAAVSSLVARTPDTKTAADPARLYKWEAEDEAEDLRRQRLDDASVRAVQVALGTPPTGTFAPADAQALSHLRVRHKLGRGGILDGAAVNAIVREQVAAGREQEMIHLVVDFHRLDTGTDTLAIRFDSTQAAASAVTFEANTLRRIILGPTALKSARTIAAAIREQLAPEPPSAFIPALPTPAVLTDDEADKAVVANAAVLTDRRSVLAIQGILRAPATGEFDLDTSQFIADRQKTLGLTLTSQDGTIDDDFFHHLIRSLNANADHEALIRLVIDYKRIKEGAVIDVAFDPNLDPSRDFLVTSAGAGAAMSLAFGPAAFSGQTAPTIANTIVNGFDHARLRLQAGATP